MVQVTPSGWRHSVRSSASGRPRQVYRTVSTRAVAVDRRFAGGGAAMSAATTGLFSARGTPSSGLVSPAMASSATIRDPTDPTDQRQVMAQVSSTPTTMAVVGASVYPSEPSRLHYNQERFFFGPAGPYCAAHQRCPSPNTQRPLSGIVVKKVGGCRGEAPDGTVCDPEEARLDVHHDRG